MSDPIVDEIQKIRDEYARQFNYDLDAIYRDLKEQESRSNRTFVDRPIIPSEKPLTVDSQEKHAWSDPIVDEIHKTREAILERHNYDLEAVCRDMRERQGDEDGTESATLSQTIDQPPKSTEAA